MRKHEGPLLVAQISCCCLLILSTFCSPAASQNANVHDESDVLQLTIQTDKKVYTEENNIPIHAQVTNVSRRDVFIGREMWTNDSPSHAWLAITAVDGHHFEGLAGAVDIVAAIDDLPREVLRGCISLPPGHSYGSNTFVQNYAQAAGLIPGLYKVRAIFESRGIDANTYFNPLLGNAKELEGLRPQDWKGLIQSNELTIRIVARR